MLNKKNLVVFLISLLPVFLNTFPNYYAYIHTPNNMVFSGQASWFDPWDINIYVSSLKSGQTNGFLLSNLYTTIPNQPILMYPLYTILGIIFKNIPPFFIFHLFAAIFGFILVFGIFHLLKYFVEKNIERFLALIAICLGTGLGFFYPRINSPDASMTSFTFQSAFQRPHEAIAVLFYLAALVFFFRKKIFTTSLFLLITVFFYPFYLLSFALICSLYLFIKNKSELKFANYLPLFYILIPSLVTNLFISSQISSNGTFQSVLSQNLPTPNPLLLLSGYGIITLLILYSLLFIKKNEKTLFLLTWFVASFILSFTPFGFSRFFLRGLFFPTVILSVLAINDLTKKIKVNYFIFYILFFILILPANLKIFSERITATKSNNPWYYLSKSEFEGIKFLNAKTDNKSGVLTLYNLGNLIPAFSHNTVYFGHFLQTPDANNKLQNAYLFYSNQFPEEKAREFIKQNHVKYIFYGKEEKATKTYSKIKNDKLNYQFLFPVFQNSEIKIYSLK